MTDTPYNRKFFEARQIGAHVSADRISEWVCGLLSPKSVLDVGCGTGGWLAAFQRLGVSDVLGMDGDWVPRDRLEVPADKFRPVDLRQPLEPGRHFDLAICLEVAEHLPEVDARQLVHGLTLASPIVLFSAAVPHQGGTGHLNEQWPGYWIALFRERGYVCVDCVRGRFWNDDRVAWWYAENAFFFVAEAAADSIARLQAEARRFPLANCAVVHPALFEAKLRELSNPMSYSLRGVFQVLPALLGRAFASRLRKRHER